MKEIFIIQPYLVGSKRAKSLAVIIPAQIAKECNINTSTAFSLRVDRQTKVMTLNIIDTTTNKFQKHIMTPIGESLEASSQQVSSSGAQ